VSQIKLAADRRAATIANAVLTGVPVYTTDIKKRALLQALKDVEPSPSKGILTTVDAASKQERANQRKVHSLQYAYSLIVLMQKQIVDDLCNAYPASTSVLVELGKGTFDTQDGTSVQRLIRRSAGNLIKNANRSLSAK
jgi:hypothetical protein